MSAPDRPPGPLRHLKVLDLSRMFPGAFCTLLLADLGAEVVKVEGPGVGDPLRGIGGPGVFNASHVALNRGKRSLVLDLRQAAAGDVLRRLVRWADVVVESHRPGQLDSLGFGYEVMSTENPKIVWCSITGFGDFGPNRDAPGHDITYLGYAGLLAKLGDGAATPPQVTVSLPIAGLTAAVGILAAVADAERTGHGSRLDTNMVDATTWTISEDVARAANAPSDGWGASAARNVYECADGRSVTVAASEQRTWSTLCAALDLPDLGANPPRGADDAPAAALVAAKMRTRPASYWNVHPGLAGGVGPVNTALDLLDDAQLIDRESIVVLPESGHRVLANPIRFASALGGAASHGLSDPPELGADTTTILRDAGFTAPEIDALLSAQVVAC